MIFKNEASTPQALRLIPSDLTPHKIQFTDNLIIIIEEPFNSSLENTFQPTLLKQYFILITIIEYPLSSKSDNSIGTQILLSKEHNIISMPRIAENQSPSLLENRLK